MENIKEEWCSLEEAQKQSAVTLNHIVQDSLKQKRNVFYLIEILRTIGEGSNTKFQILFNCMNHFSEQEAIFLGFQTMVSRFTLSSCEKKYHVKVLHHILDKSHLLVIDKMDESYYINLCNKLKKEDVNAYIALKSSRSHAKRLLKGI